MPRKRRRDWFSIALVSFFGIFLTLFVIDVRNPGWAGSHVRAWSYAGTNVECNVCGRTFREFMVGPHTANQLTCPYCLSKPRHRTAYRYFVERSDLFDHKPKRMLHVSPELSLARQFQTIPNLDYLSGDLDPRFSMVQMDITKIQYPDNSFDVIYCSHVLEHVPEDRKAIRELARVLKPDGWAMIMVPVVPTDQTYEDPAIIDPGARQKAFGQWDHVRAYGRDFVDRLRENGCEVTVDRFASAFSEDDVRRFGLSREDIYLCRKKAS